MQENEQTVASEKNYLPLVLVGIFLVLAFMALVFIKMNQNKAAGTAVDLSTLGNEVSPSADLSVTDEVAKAYLFTSETCPHCQNVANYLTANKEVYDLVGLQVKGLNDEATYEERQAQLAAFAQTCGLATNSVGIPFLYLDDADLAVSERCLVGDTPILAYLQSKKN